MTTWQLNTGVGGPPPDADAVARRLCSKFGATDADVVVAPHGARVAVRLSFEEEVRAVVAATALSAVRDSAEFASDAWFGPGFRPSGLPSAPRVVDPAAEEHWRGVQADVQARASARASARAASPNGSRGVGEAFRATKQRLDLLPRYAGELAVLGIPPEAAGTLTQGQLRAAMRARARTLQRQHDASPTAGAGSAQMYALTEAFEAIRGRLDA